MGDAGRWRRVLLRRGALPGHRQPGPAEADPAEATGADRGLGKKRTPALAAAYADEFNLPFVDEDTTAAQFDRVRVACESAERDPATMRWSNALVVCVGSDEAEIARRASAIGREVDELRANGLAGTPSEVVDKIGRYAALGAERFYLQVLDLADLDHLATLRGARERACPPRCLARCRRANLTACPDVRCRATRAPFGRC